MRNRAQRLDICVALALFAGNLLILGPWLLTEYSDQPWNNGYIYIGIARLFRDHAWSWNPLQYGGAPFRYLYPPIFHVMVAAMSFLSLGRAFHLVTGVGYALAPVALYVLGRQLFATRLPAVFAAVGYSVFPSFAYGMTTWRNIAQPYAFAPWGFVALAAFDEAAHAFALPLMLLAVAAAWNNRWVAASVLAGAVFLTNWPGLIGLGFALVGVAVTRRTVSRVAGVVGTAYGLSAFWMTPGYFVSSTLLNRIVLRHTLFAAPWSSTTTEILVAALALIGLSFVTRVPPAIRLCLVWVALAGFVVVSYTIGGNYFLPSPHRYMLEFNAGLVLLAAGVVALLPKRAQIAVLLLASAASWRFVAHAWKMEPKAADPRTGVAFETASWLGANTNGSRVMVAGELDNTLNLWTDVPEVGGTGQDISNFLMFAVERQVSLGCGVESGEVAEQWLRAVNTPWLVVHGPKSREYFHWFSQPAKFAGLPVAWTNSAGDTVYRVPDFASHEAVVVDLGALAGLPRIESTADRRFLEAYVKWAAGKRPVDLRWSSTSEAVFDAELAEGEGILVKLNNDAGWSVSGASILSDPIGFQLIQASPGTHRFTLHFGASGEAWLGRAITLITIILLFAGVHELLIAGAAIVPALAAWAVLMGSVPPTAAVAEDTFIRVKPPLINPGGIVTSPQKVVSIYGLDFGGPNDGVRVWMNDKAIVPEYHGANLINFRFPADAPKDVSVGVEVNGCRGNEFQVRTQ